MKKYGNKAVIARDSSDWFLIGNDEKIDFEVCSKSVFFDLDSQEAGEDGSDLYENRPRSAGNSRFTREATINSTA